MILRVKTNVSFVADKGDLPLLSVLLNVGRPLMVEQDQVEIILLQD